MSKIKAMRTQSIAIQEISLFTGKDEICLKGRMSQDQLSYDTTVFISSTQLNKIINQLQLQNEDEDVSGSFSSSLDNEGNRFMWLDTQKWNNTMIEWEILSTEEKQLRIRA